MSVATLFYFDESDACMRSILGGYYIWCNIGMHLLIFLEMMIKKYILIVVDYNNDYEFDVFRICYIMFHKNIA